MVNRIWPTAMADKADNVSSVSASGFHIGGPNTVNPGQIPTVVDFQLRGTLNLIPDSLTFQMWQAH